MNIRLADARKPSPFPARDDLAVQAPLCLIGGRLALIWAGITLDKKRDNSFDEIAPIGSVCLGLRGLLVGRRIMPLGDPARRRPGKLAGPLQVDRGIGGPMVYLRPLPPCL